MANETSVNPAADEVRRLDKRWAEAEVRGDARALRRLLADDFAAIGPRGFMLSKDQWLERYSSGALQTEAISQCESQLRIYGDTAIVTGRETQKSRYRGSEAGGEFRSARVFVRQAGQWRLASLQLSPVLEAPA